MHARAVHVHTALPGPHHAINKPQAVAALQPMLTCATNYQCSLPSSIAACLLGQPPSLYCHQPTSCTLFFPAKPSDPDSIMWLIDESGLRLSPWG
mmetsp:Transcript_2574/g.6595  ORF Transcript_2574/g.6595 Transcript_2574/m.6595 type:complete len:95 (-) Transcript_2574:440-724(-)